ncbi:MAG TPA: hypothetical protein VFX58_06550 [Chitinophagaceae bacterium]|nr:hypothetical protein [Chitinophagaceae bacterium]
MATNIIEAIQMNLGYAGLQKIDPNLQDTPFKTDHSAIEKLGQGAIPAVLTALYKLSRTPDGCRALLAGDDKQDWLTVIYGNREKEAVEKVAHYAVVTENQAESHMENIADEAIKIVRSAAGNPATPEGVRNYMNSQRHNILVYLPAALNMGDVLNDEGLDDKTNKMEGPVSNFMHKIENTLSGGGNK